MIGGELTLPVEVCSKRFFRCPECGEHEFFVEHLIRTEDKRQAGPWFCDECGSGWIVQVTSRTVEVTRSKERVEPIVVELAYGELRFFVETRVRVGDREEPEFSDQQQYFYEEHTCPTNWLKEVERVVLGDDTDPHGFAKFVSWRPGELDDEESSADGMD